MKLFTNKTVAFGMAAILTMASIAYAGVTRFGTVEAFDTDIWTFWATSGASRIVVDGDGDTDLDCFVYDRFGTLLGSDTDATDYCIVNIYQRSSGNIRVRIENLGSVYNEYRISLD